MVMMMSGARLMWESGLCVGVCVIVCNNQESGDLIYGNEPDGWERKPVFFAVLWSRAEFWEMLHQPDEYTFHSEHINISVKNNIKTLSIATHKPETMKKSCLIFNKLQTKHFFWCLFY